MKTVAEILKAAGFVPVVPDRAEATGTPETQAQSHVPVVPGVPVPKTESSKREGTARLIVEYQLGDPGVWMVMLCQPGDTMEQAERWLRQKFGERLANVRERKSTRDLNK